MPDKLQLVLNEASDIISRALLAQRLGQSYQGKRDLYEALGWPLVITFDDYLGKYERMGLARRIVRAMPEACWSDMPGMWESETKTDTKFETAWADLVKKISLASPLLDLDVLAGIGEYGILYLGFDDGGLLSDPVQSARNLMYVTPYHQGNVEVAALDQDMKSPRYGQPVQYRLKVSLPSGTVTTGELVHYSRVLHVAENCLGSSFRGEPRLKCVYNNMIDIEKITGGSGEMFWQGAFPGISFEAAPDVDLSFSSEAITEEIEKYVHGLKRYLKLQGVSAKPINSTLQSPDAFLDVQLRMVSAATGIPKRMLEGSERGELSSRQDSDTWNGMVEARRTLYCKDKVIVPFATRLVDVGVLPAFNNSISVVWESRQKSETELADLSAKRTDALAKYATSGIDSLMTFDAFLRYVCEYQQDIVDLIVQSSEEAIREMESREPAMPKEDPEEEALKEEPKKEDLAANFSAGQRRAPKGTSIGGQWVPEGWSTSGASKGEDGKWRDSTGKELSESDQSRLKALGVPPAWTGVRLNPDPNAIDEYQALGYDSKGRLQRKYDKAKMEKSSIEKFEGLQQLKPHVRGLISESITGAKAGDGTSAALLLTMKTGMRPGGAEDTGGAVQAYGVSTLTGAHVKVDGSTVNFDFVGKKGVQQTHYITSPILADYIKKRNAGPNDTVFNTTDEKMRDRVKEITGNNAFSTKDLRTWRATTDATRLVRETATPTSKKEYNAAKKTIAEKVSKRLGNNPSEALKSYISPTVWSGWGAIE
ncbi:MAG: hypothetical protein BWK76_23090 [Desulfobulbaceae bacterium A2]|nr:MAG: hypothetical protein BWK76_23090 [Desulfobulbaceae bacterium A2]